MPEEVYAGLIIDRSSANQYRDFITLQPKDLARFRYLDPFWECLIT